MEIRFSCTQSTAALHYRGNLALSYLTLVRSYSASTNCGLWKWK